MSRCMDMMGPMPSTSSRAFPWGNSGLSRRDVLAALVALLTGFLDLAGEFLNPHGKSRNHVRFAHDLSPLM
jgi:hypothetical protein